MFQYAMFYGASAFNQPLLDWDVSASTDPTTFNPNESLSDGSNICRHQELRNWDNPPIEIGIIATSGITKSGQSAYRN